MRSIERSNRRQRLVASLVSLIAAGALTGALSGPPAARAATARAAHVTVDRVRLEQAHQTLEAIGSAVARESGVVAARVAGPVVDVRVHAGDRVEKNDVIAVLDESLRKAELGRRDAELALQKARAKTAEVRLGLATQELERLAALRNTAAFPRARYQDQRQEVARYRSEIDEARATVDRAQSDRKVAEIELARTHIRASYPGSVLSRHTSPGAYLKPGDPVVSMVNDRAMEIEVAVPADRLQGLEPGTRVPFTLARAPGQGRFLAAVRAVIPKEDPLTRTRAVRLTPVASQAGRVTLAENESVVLELPVGPPRKALTVHKDAIIVRGNGRMVFVVEDGKALPRPVRLGEALGARFEVLDGLQSGDLVVTRGNERLRPGQPVRYESRS